MKITDLLNKGTLSLSFEVFPPKTNANFESVKSAVEEIAKLSPSFMSVTYGAGGGTSKYTLEIANDIKERYGVSSLAHLTCVSSTKETVRERIEEMKNIGIENVMALRGDLVAGSENDSRENWDYRHAVDLVRELKECGVDFLYRRSMLSGGPSRKFMSKGRYKISERKSRCRLRFSYYTNVFRQQPAL